MRPDKLLAVGSALRAWGASPAAGIAASAIRRPDRVAVIDERGERTFAELESRSNSLARALRREAGVQAGDSVAVMCRNHGGFVEAIFACAKLGATVLLMNTDFAGPAARRRRRARTAEGGRSTTPSSPRCSRTRPRASPHVVSWGDEGDSTGASDRRRADRGHVRRPARSAGRSEPLRHPHLGHDGHAEGRAAQLARLARAAGGPVRPDPAAGRARDPHRRADVSLLGLPPLHARARARLDLRSAAPLQARGGAADGRRAPHRRAGGRAGDAAADHGADPRDPRPSTTSPAFAWSAASGSALPGELATRWMDGFGDNLYNLYGSTEVAWASIATPEDMRAAPGTAGTAAPRHRGADRRRGRQQVARRERPAGSSSATRWPSRAIRAAAARTASTG